MTKVAKTVGGGWVNAGEIQSGVKIKIVSEAETQQGEYGETLVAKVRVQGGTDDLNLRINKPSKNALIDAFGDDTVNWINKIVVAQTERSVIGGKRVTILYLVPEGFFVGEDAGGYVVITRNKQNQQETNTDNQEENINPDEIPF